MATGTVRVGVIGVGGMGSGHCTQLPKIPEAELAAVCDTNPATLKAVTEKYGAPGFATHEALLDSGLVDAIIIATPHYFHPPIAIDAFARGLHVLSEKPLAVTVSSADAMIAAAKRSGKKFAVMYQMRSEGQNRAARAAIESGRLGEIYRTSLVMGWYRSQAYYDSGGWRATWNGEGGGVLINQAPHYLDLFTWLGGMPSRITGTTRTRLHDIEVEDEAFATLEYANGAHGYLYASTTEVPNHNMLEICGDRGKLVLHGSSLKVYEVGTPIRKFTHESTEMWAGPKAEEVPVEIPPDSPLKGHAVITQNFARSILRGEPLISPGEEGLRAVEMINGLILSSKTGKPVTVPVDRAAYDRLIEELKTASRPKAAVREQRVTDPAIAN
ncbi:MAG TPA: Gfo/Idh/MocA family oxidoreductase [Chthonomonadaceae bacterium]|nr:Gfo/Idh/MocA family oxidoreductase [Chthonomonadaceae bacterium]